MNVSPGDIFWIIAAVVGLLGIGGLLLAVWFFNPFRSGH